MASLYAMKIEELKGLGKKRAELFHKLGVYSVGQLLNFYPRTYEDWSEITDIADVQDGQTVCVSGELTSGVQSGYTKTGKFIAKVFIADETGVCELVFFNNPYIRTMLKTDVKYRFFGKAARRFSEVQMISPTFSAESDLNIIKPIYNLTAGLPNNVVVKAVRQAVDLLPEEVNDPLPGELREKYGLCGLRFAIENIHFPQSSEALNTAKKRLVIEELLVLNLGLRQLKNRKRSENKNLIKTDFSAEFESLLSFKLTNAQRNAVADCVRDIMNPEVSMNRLVQGDVGSGKTVVATVLHCRQKRRTGGDNGSD